MVHQLGLDQEGGVVAAAEVSGRRRLVAPFVHYWGHCWLARGIDDWPGDDESALERSPLMLLENGQPLGPPHALHQHIGERGRGRYSHWQQNLFFSTSDHSDPNRNGRHYEIVALPGTRLPLAAEAGAFAQTLVAVYDLASEIMSYDFVWFMAWADLERRRRGLARGHLLVVPGWHGIVRDEQAAYEQSLAVEQRDQRLYDLILPIIRLFPDWSGVTVAASRREAGDISRLARHLVPDTFHPWGTFPVHHLAQDRLSRAALAGETVAVLTPPPAAVATVRDWLARTAGGRRPISLTMRQYGFRPGRNSNLEAWLAFAESLDPRLYFPVWVPDTATALEPQPVLSHGAVMAAASVNLLLRAALYHVCYLNLGINNGPLALMVHNPACRYLGFHMVNENAPETSRAFIESRGLAIGSDYPFATPFQHFIWEPDQLEILQREFARMVARIEAAAADPAPQL